MPTRAAAIKTSRHVLVCVTATVLVAVGPLPTTGGLVPTSAGIESPPGAPPSAFRPTGPVRVADSRISEGLDPIAPNTFRLRLGDTIDRQLGGATVTHAAALSITALGGPGFVAVAPAGGPAPNTSVVNLPTAGGVASATTIARLGEDRSIDIFLAGDAREVIVDLMGVFVESGPSSSGRLVVAEPNRIVDTRDGAVLERGSSLRVQRPSAVPADAVAVAVNVTAVPHDPAGFLTVYPTDGARPETSVINAAGVGQVRAAFTIVPTGPEGFEIYTSARTDVIVDLVGWFTGPSSPTSSDGLFISLDQPQRRLDTRADGPAVLPGESRRVSLWTDASAVSGSIVHTESAGAGYLTVHPTLGQRPLVSSVNTNSYLETVANGMIAALSTEGVDVFTSAGGHVVMDVTGWFIGAALPGGDVDVERSSRSLAYPTGECERSVPSLPPLTGSVVPDRFVQLGTSVQGRPIYAEYYGPSDPGAVVLVVGQVHGNECAPLLLVDAIRSRPSIGYGLWLIPTLNPDGHASYSRANSVGVDLNKDGYSQSQPETRALMRFTSTVKPALTLHVHSPNGQVAWYGAGQYVAGDPARSGAARSGPLAAKISASTGLDFRGAGRRSALSTWFLWQGQQMLLPGHESLLVELYAVGAGEVPGARPRPPTRSISAVQQHCQSILDALESAF